MFWFNRIVSLLLLITTPTLILSPAIAAASPPSVPMTMVSSPNWMAPPVFTYDQVLDLINAIDEGALDDISTPEELENILRFIVYVTQKGASFVGEACATEVCSDTYDLLSDDVDGGSLLASRCIWTPEGGFSLAPAVYRQQGDIILCKSWASKKIQQIKHYVHKHKKAFIIGGAVVVAAVAVVCVAAAVATAGTAALGEAGAAAASGLAATAKDKDNHKSDDPEKEKSPSQEEPICSSHPLLDLPVSNPSVSQAVEKQIDLMQEMNTDKSIFQEVDSASILGEAAREIGSKLVHEIVDGASDLCSVVPKLQEEAQGLTSTVFANEQSISANNLSPVVEYQNQVANVHEFVDKVFSTDQADLYSPEAKESRDRFTVGIIPPPGSQAASMPCLKKLIDSGKVEDRAGFTKAGRGLMKHGYREGSVFPKPTGNPAQINAQGHQVLEKILNHPDRKVLQHTHKMHGPVIDIEAPGLGGVRFNKEGTEMIGFLEPRLFLDK